MERKYSYISFSEYRLFLSCEHKHFLTKGLKLQEPSNKYLVFGSAIHNSLEEIVKKKSVKLMWGNIFNKHLKKEAENFPLSAWEKSTFEKQGLTCLHDLDFFNRFKNYKVFSIEEEILLPLYEDEEYLIDFKGFVDLILYDEAKDEYLILDYKSAEKPWDLPKKYGVIERSPNEFVFPDTIENTSEGKSFFGQVVLYKIFISVKHNIPIEKIKMAYITLPKEGGYPQRYDVEVGEKYMNFVLKDLKEKALDILNINPLQLKKNKIDGDKKSCFFCFFKNSPYCNDEKNQVIPIEIN